MQLKCGPLSCVPSLVKLVPPPSPPPELLFISHCGPSHQTCPPSTKILMHLLHGVYRGPPSGVLAPLCTQEALTGVTVTLRWPVLLAPS